jgi:hypothetical protein
MFENKEIHLFLAFRFLYRFLNFFCAKRYGKWANIENSKNERKTVICSNKAHLPPRFAPKNLKLNWSIIFFFSNFDFAFRCRILIWSVTLHVIWKN